MSRTLSKFAPTLIATALLTAGCGGSDASAPVSPPDAEALVTGVVTRNDGSPVAGARVQVSTRYPEVMVSDEQAKGVLTDEDGRYELNLLARDFPRSYVSGSLAVGQTMQTGFFRDTVLVFVTFDLAEPAALNTVDVVVDP